MKHLETSNSVIPRQILRFSAFTIATISILAAVLIYNANSKPHPKVEQASAQGTSPQTNPDIDWPQLQHDPQRSGYTNNTIPIDESKYPDVFKTAWYKNFQPERVSKDVQAIICYNKVFVPTQSGSLYALAYNTGVEAWKYNIGSPILHTAACENQTVIVASIDGRVTAINTETGQLAWTFQSEGHTGFVTSPLIVENTVYIGEMSGIFYALNLFNGVKRWSLDVGNPILNTAAYNNGKIYFCDEGMWVHALNYQNGSEVWKSRIYGQSCKQYHPVIIGGYVMIRPLSTQRFFDATLMNIKPFVFTWDETERQAYYNTYADFATGNGLNAELNTKEDQIISNYINHPYYKTFFVLNESDGQEAFIPPHFNLVLTLPGPPPPPVSDGTGKVLMPWIFTQAIWGKLNLQTHKVDEVIIPPTNKEGTSYGINGDETTNVSIGGHLLFIMHTNERVSTVGFSGVYNFQLRRFYNFNPNMDYLPYGVSRRFWQLSEYTENGNNSASIANGYFYHISLHQIAAWKAL